MFMTASLVFKGGVSLHEILDTCIVNSIVSFPISVFMTSVGNRDQTLELGPTVYAQHFVTYRYVFDTYICTCLYIYMYMPAILHVLVIDINVALILTWEGLGIMLMTLRSWFDLVLGLNVYTVNGCATIHLFTTSNCSTN